MDEELTVQHIKLVPIDCPPELFDTNDAYVMRRKRVAVWKLDAIKASKDPNEVYKIMSELIPEWYRVLDVDTEELLPDPRTDPSVFSRLDNEQLVWMVKILQAKPDKPGKPTSGRM